MATVAYDFQKAMPPQNSPSFIRSNLGVIIALVIQTAGIVWWASSLSAQVAVHNAEIEKIKGQMSVAAAQVLTRDQLQDILGARDEKLENLNNQLNEFKNETRQMLIRIESKL